MNFLRRQLRFRDYRYGTVAAVTALAYLAVVLVSLGIALYYQVNPAPEAVGATFEALPAIVLTAPTSFVLLPFLQPLTFFIPAAGVPVLLLPGLVQAFLFYALIRGRRKPAHGPTWEALPE
ncbi:MULTISPECIES: SCO4225 family membrane protein [Kocuria]|uniref:SCO4225 family membrane protein n=1 Tax=Kocuria TaxID=57493 RepID=UPI0022E52E42|nr:hypothetical protein [Kocuria marina]